MTPTSTTPLPDVVLSGGPVFDGGMLLPAGVAVAVVDGRVAAIGPQERVRAQVAELGVRPETIDLAGRLLHPGFTDAHVHALSGGVDCNACDLTGAVGAADALHLVARYAERTSADWIVGSGWSMSDFPGGCPTAAQLDAVLPDRPALLLNRDHHGAWVNTAALLRAGITATTADPPDGRIERDADGNPTGTLHEGAMELVARLVPETTAEEAMAGLLTAQTYLHSLGITGWQEAIVGRYPGMDHLDRAYRSADERGVLTGEVVGASWLPREVTVDSVADLVAEFAAARDETAGRRWSLHSVKIMADGVLENRTAWLTDPYEQPVGCPCDPDRGLAYFDPGVLGAATVAADAAGLDVHFHAIGDAAVRHALDAVEHARRVNGVSGGRHHIAHLQLVEPSDVRRFRPLDVTANLQAFWACNDEQLTTLVRPVIGARRFELNYPFADMVAHGTRLAMGSDWPVSTPDPWAAMAVAVTRAQPGGAEPLLPAQRLDLRTVLAAYTAGSAWQNRRAAGRLVVGARADFAVADRDPFEAGDDEIHQVSTDLTVADGRVVYERSTA